MSAACRHLRQGDLVGVIAPAGSPAPERMPLVGPLFERFGLRALPARRFHRGRRPDPVLREHLASLGKPVLSGWPAGHAEPNRALPLGARVSLDADAGTLMLDEAVLA